MTTRRATAISLFFELGEIEGVADATRMLAVDLQGEPWPDNPEAVRKLYSVGSVLALLVGRIRLLRDAVQGEVDPRLLRAPHNEVDASERGDVKDFKIKLTPLRKARR